MKFSFIQKSKSSLSIIIFKLSLLVVITSSGTAGFRGIFRRRDPSLANGSSASSSSDVMSLVVSFSMCKNNIEEVPESLSFRFFSLNAISSAKICVLTQRTQREMDRWLEVNSFWLSSDDSYFLVWQNIRLESILI